MKKLLVTFFSLLVCSLLMGQQIHTVVRGETTEGIAHKYGVTTEKLVELNPLLKMGCHVGMDLKIPEKEAPKQEEFYSTGVSSNSDDVYSYLAKADAAYDKKNYSSARRYYTKVLSYWADDANTYFNRGLCNYQMDNYGLAADDFERCLSRNPGAETAKRAKDLLNKSKELKRRQAEEGAKILGGIAMFALGTALVAGTAIAASNAQPSHYGSLSSRYPVPSYNYGSRLSMSDLDRITAQARYETARNSNQIYAMSVQRVAMAQMQQAQINADFNAKTQQMVEDAHWKLDLDNPVNQLSMELSQDYERNPYSYISQESRNSRYSALYKDKYGRSPSMRELSLFEEKFQAMLAYQANQSGYSDNTSSTKENEFSSSSVSSTHDYAAEYAKLEELVKSEFDGWKAMGGVHIDKGKEFGAEASNSYNTGMFAMIRRNQKEMARVRTEAAKHGVHISKSPWETTNVSYY